MAKGRRSGGATGTSTGDAERGKTEATPKPVIADVTAPSEAPRGKLEKLRWAKPLAWILIGVISVLIGINFLAEKVGIGDKAKTASGKTAAGEVELRYKPDMDRWQAVGDSTVFQLNVRTPYYQLAFDSLRAGELIRLRADGVYGFDQFIGLPVGPDGWRQKPADLPRTQKPSQYALKSATMGALLGAFGEVVITPEDQEHIPRVQGTKHFFVGTEQYIVVPDSLPTSKLYLMINERWTPGSGQDNWGRCTVKISRYRPA